MGVIPFPSPAAIPDATARAQALDVSQSWIVEAPAGSGKTGLLTQRFLKLLPTVDDPAQVLALTFTNKATAEMRERVVAALRSAMEPLPADANDFDRLTHTLAAAALEHDAALGWRLVERPFRLNIRTIDSLCGEIARTLPLGGDEASFARPVPDAAPLYRRAAHAVMMGFGGDDAALNDAVRTVLLHRDGDLPFCEGVLAEMLGSREQWGRLVPLEEHELDDDFLNANVLPRLNAALDRTLCSALTYLHSCFPQDELDRIAAIAAELAHAEGYGDNPSAFASCAHAGTPAGDAIHIDHWRLLANLLLTNGGTWRKTFPVNLVGAKVAKHLSDELKELIPQIDSDELAALLHGVRSLPSLEYPPEQWVVAKALFRLLKRALVELHILFASDQVCDFAAISLAARAALRTNAAEVHKALGPGLRHLLVDEMQDTSSTQYELLEALTEGWDGRTQTVFLVGDPKQSIYLFRQARVELFQRVEREKQLGRVPLSPLLLSANFRSGSELVGQFNEAFRSIFPEDVLADGDVTYSDAASVRPAALGEGISWQTRLLPQPEDGTTSIRQRRRALRQEARAIAGIVAEWQRGHTDRPQKIAVLARARTHVTEIVKALAQAGVAYRAVEIEGLAERSEVLDALAITRALCHPADRTAWLAVLRAPWCGAGLADLFTLATGDDAARRKQALRQHLRERAATLQQPVHGRILRTLDVMDAALQHSGTEPLASRVERTWRSLGGDLCTDALGRENVRQFLRVVDAMETEGERVDAASLDRRLGRLFAEASSSPDAVDVMTIHKAKGLEWDLVLVPGLHRLGGQDRWPLLDSLELPTEDADGVRDVLLAPLPPKGVEAGGLNTFIRNTRRRREAAELKRVFYVAATRARTSLHLFAWPEATQSGQPADRKSTLMKAAWNAIGRRLIPVAVADVAAADTDPAAPEAAEESFALAAAAEESLPAAAPLTAQRTVMRLPGAIDPLARLHARSLALPQRQAARTGTVYQRPDGSYGARVVGNAIHAFAERAATEVAARVAAGSDAEDTLNTVAAAVPSWRDAMLSTLRAGGLPPDAARRAALTVEQALSRMLASPEGRWLLMPHTGAATETAWRASADEGTVRVRMDRSFFAGTEPGAPGSDTLWIIDLKTGNRDSLREQDELLAEGRIKYAAQLDTYAQVRLQALPTEAQPTVMLALFYPLMGRIIYWPYVIDSKSIHSISYTLPEPKVEPAIDLPVAETQSSAADTTEQPPENKKGQFQLFG